jgi:hypothetical protein
MAALLMPAPLLLAYMGPGWNPDLPYARWPYYERERMVSDLADLFDVSPTLARYRLEDFVRKSLPKLRDAHLTGKSYATLALCWPAPVFEHLRAA